MCAKKKSNGEKKTKESVEKLGLVEREREREERESGQERENPRAKRNIFRASERKTHQSADK
jgi:hypothetical protein